MTNINTLLVNTRIETLCSNIIVWFDSHKTAMRNIVNFHLFCKERVRMFAFILYSISQDTVLALNTTSSGFEYILRNTLCWFKWSPSVHFDVFKGGNELFSWQYECTLDFSKRLYMITIIPSWSQMIIHVFVLLSNESLFMMISKVNKNCSYNKVLLSKLILSRKNIIVWKQKLLDYPSSCTLVIFIDILHAAKTG